MSLVLNDEQQMLMDSAAEFFKQKASVTAFRELRSADQKFDKPTWQSIIDFGWPAILVPEEHDGLGFGISGLGLIAIEAGKNLMVSPLLSNAAISVSALLQCKASLVRDQLLHSIAAGELIVTLARSEKIRFEPESINTIATKTEHGFELSGNKAYVAESSYADTLLVVARHDSKLGLFVVDANAPGVTKSIIQLMDHRDYANIEFDGVQVDQSQMLDWQDEASAVANSIDVGALMAACELYGCALEAFERTRVYLCDREQFGRKIGSFQALQHRMAHAYTQLELLKSVLMDSMQALESNRKDASLAISHAKTLANDTARLVTLEAIQMHGGIGITDELDIGLFYKRARVLQATYGDSNYHKNRFATLSGY